MNRKKLLASLSAVKPAIGTNDLIPILMNACFKDGYLTGFNGNIAIRVPCEFGVDALVSGSTLIGLLSNSQAKNIEALVENNVCIVKATRSRFKLPMPSFDDFPFDEPDTDKMNSFNLTDDYINGIAKCLVSVNKDPNALGRLGIIVKSGKKTSFYSTDNISLSKFTIKGRIKGTDVIILPPDFCVELIRLCKMFDVNKVKIYLSETEIVAYLTSDVFIYSSLDPPDNVHNLEKVISDTIADLDKDQVVDIPSKMDKCLSRALVVVEQKQKLSLRSTSLVVRKGKLILTTSRPEGTVRDVIKLSKEIDNVSLLVNPVLIQRILGSIDNMAFLDRCLYFRNKDGDFEHLITAQSQ